MKKTKISCWTETHRRMKWRMAGGIASPPKEKIDKQDIGLASWSRQQNQNKKMSWKTKKKMGRRC